MNSFNGVSEKAWRDYCEMIDNMFGDIFEKKADAYERKKAEHRLEAKIPERQRILDQVLNRCEKAETGCLEWQGAAATYKGYGRIKIGGKLHSPHRAVAWAMDMVDSLSDPERQACVLHRCDNPKCCNPDHLFVGSMSENMIDCAQKGRLAVQHKKRNRQL